MTNGNGTPPEGAPPQLNVLAQYTKDLSFENPNAPASLAPQQQQPAIGRALASRPQLLILDEPTEGIQPSVIKEIGEVIRQLASRGDMAILLVEQFYDFAAGLADHYLVMSRGAIVQQGKGGDMESDSVRAMVTI